MEQLLACLRAGAESTRLRLLALLAHNELTVSELTRIVGQSQPRVSRHLKLLTEAKLIQRHQEGTWVFYRLALRGPAAAVARSLVEWIPADDPALVRDLERLEEVRRARQVKAADYFAGIADRWDRIRTLYVAESAVEEAMLEAVGDGPIDEMLDLGTGTGRVLEVFGQRIGHGLGIDLSREMLAVARAKLDAARLNHCQVRQGDLYNLALADGCMNVVTVHHVLHFLDDPARAVREAARALAPGGRLVLVDFAPHRHEFLRTDYAHRRLGFADHEVTGWCRDAGLESVTVQHLATQGGGDETLVVSLWTAVQRDDAPQARRQEAA